MARWKTSLLSAVLASSMVGFSPASAQACPILDCLFGWMCCSKKRPVCPPPCPPPACDPCATGAAVYYQPGVTSYRPITTYDNTPSALEPMPSYEIVPSTQSALPEFGAYEPLPSARRVAPRPMVRQPIATSRIATASPSRVPVRRVVQGISPTRPVQAPASTSRAGDLRGRRVTTASAPTPRQVRTQQPIVRTATRSGR